MRKRLDAIGSPGAGSHREPVPPHRPLGEKEAGIELRARDGMDPASSRGVPGEFSGRVTDTLAAKRRRADG